MRGKLADLADSGGQFPPGRALPLRFCAKLGQCRRKPIWVRACLPPKRVAAAARSLSSRPRTTVFVALVARCTDPALHACSLAVGSTRSSPAPAWHGCPSPRVLVLPRG